MRTPLLAAGLVAGGLLLAGCSEVSTAPDEVALHYSGGTWSSQKFQKCVQSGTHQFNGPGDNHYAYPKGQRTFDFSGPDSDPITVVSKDGIEMTVPGIATFSLNTDDCERLRQFHEQLGIKFQAYMQDGQTTDGWKQLLTAYLKQPLDRAMDAAALGWSARELWSNPEVKTAYEAKVKELTPIFAREQAGQDFFGGLNITVQKPQLPDAIAQAIAAQQEAILQNQAQKEKNTTALTELEALRKAADVLGPDWAVIYRLGKEGKITVLPVPQGSNVTVPR